MNEQMPDEFWQGVEQFNAGQYYACHDTLESLWIEATEPEKTFYQGILQIAVALYHLNNKNLRGAMILLGEGSNRLRRYPSEYGGIDVDELLIQSAALLKALQQTEPEKIAALNLGQDKTLLLPRIIKVNHDKA
ncbi:DUF309 domain-containing protein [Brasilonema sp. UFV-L1]|uniref:DUF309 domain-containing protein n=1 Tax=Brasilonema sp. UFV-L1 TaxID=2234130 RepID=UPI00145FA12C|nr:DUF309 domain-containing protein [Brasilonema sp. UFV-L1]NMG09535.1 DUF309 domain-containing protein [Brasilonema sp. UFV-L1]